MENEIKNMRLIQIYNKLFCKFVEQVPRNEFDKSKQIYISDEDRLAIGLTKCFDLETNTLIDYDNSQEIAKRQKLDRIQELKSLLSKTDYQAIKYAEGLISEQEYAPIKSQRQAYRDEINKLEALI